ncbi:MAG: DUF6788 family protein [Betaproteobacteria bacterium]
MIAGASPWSTTRRNAVASSPLQAALGRLPPFEEIVRGTVRTRELRCGKPTCHCASGPGHLASYLTVSFGAGRTEQISLPASLVAPGAGLGRQLPGVVERHRGDLRHQSGVIASPPGRSFAPTPRPAHPRAAIVKAARPRAAVRRGAAMDVRAQLLAAGASGSEASFSMFETIWMPPGSSRRSRRAARRAFATASCLPSMWCGW